MVGSVLIMALVAIFILGLHLFFRLQNVFFALGMLSVLMIIFTWLFQSSGSFAHNVTAHTGQAFGASLNHAATKAGYDETGPFSLKWTLLAGTWIYINLVFNQSSAYIGGEVRRASRLQLWSMPAAAVVTSVILLILLGLGDKIAGLHTLGELGTATALPFSAIAAQGVGSTVLAALILFDFIFFSYTWLPGQILNASRNFLAYSLDGLMPRKLGEVHPRYHTPVYSLLLVGAGSIGARWLFTHWKAFAALVGIFGFILGFAIVSVAAIAFPYRLPEVSSHRQSAGAWEGSPSCRSSEPPRWWLSESWPGRSGPIRAPDLRATSGRRSSISPSSPAGSCCTSRPSSFSAREASTSASASRRSPSSSNRAGHALSDESELIDLREQGRRVVSLAAERNVPLRLTGGVAVALRCPSAAHPRSRVNTRTSTSSAWARGAARRWRSLGTSVTARTRSSTRCTDGRGFCSTMPVDVRST